VEHSYTMVCARHALLVTALLCAANAAFAEAPVDDPQVSLRRALFDYTQGDYKAAAARLEKLLEPVQIENEDDLIEARKTLGTLYYLLGEEQKARAQFELALLIRPAAQLDLYSTAPPVLRFFDEVKAEVAKKSEEVDRIYGQRKAHFEAPRYIERDKIKHIELLCYLPFGAGQFQNGQLGLGIMFLTLDVVMLAANILGYVMHALLADKNGIIAPSKAGQRDAWLSVQYAGLAGFAGGWIAGAIHARLFFQPVVTIEHDRGKSASAPSGAELQLGLRFGLRY
jgi:tetratricopeptide (TPR) repeat protein